MKFLHPPFVAIAFLWAGSAFAQSDGRLPARGYADHDVGSDRIVEFNDDLIGGTPFEMAGVLLRHAPRVLRAGLLRPRLHFVGELVKSVENL